ncbi:uncharacterized protein MONBRDRAFT_25451 [Monosiga brevicollis MX1]|uniref:COMM domain-containing protein n=1 Tax=Monosiga brevicollis TaxID=81824 RepID=A9UZG7_MONBE|nr:uncharacterized protein MONBRDRAFT_25451 [Monosiga brevicollis MX1]EDQ89229.1 predicted protein [Monosiga brevicollis MX1]|eukprot:XP_001745805.1 hypothetical protein [Monosiga brevicollis MX1]
MESLAYLMKVPRRHGANSLKSNDRRLHSPSGGQAPSPEFVVQSLQAAYSSRYAADDMAAVTERAAEALEITPDQAKQLFRSMRDLISTVIYRNCADDAAVRSIMPDTVPGKLQGLLAKLILQNLGPWREQAAFQQLSLPRLKEFNWAIDVKTSSDQLARMALPTAVVHLKVEDLPQTTKEMPALRDVAFEMNKDTLETMLDGLGKIQEQLAAIAGSSS